MKRTFYTSLALVLSVVPFVAGAANGIADGDGSSSKIAKFLGNILGFINKVIIPFVIGIGFLLFVLGMFRYFIAGGADEDKRESGKQLMIYATLGFVLIIVFWGIVNLLTASTGLENKSLSDFPSYTPDTLKGGDAK